MSIIPDPDDFALVPFVVPRAPRKPAEIPKPWKPKKPPLTPEQRLLREIDQRRRKEARRTVSVTCPGCAGWTPGAPFGKGPRESRCCNWRCKCPLPWPDLPPRLMADVQVQIAAHLATKSAEGEGAE